jgi:hypothetical protein
MAKPKIKSEVAPNDFDATSEKKYKVIGLKESEDMPVYYGGHRFNLASLSDPEADALIQGGYPHLVRF